MAPLLAFKESYKCLGFQQEVSQPPRVFKVKRWLDGSPILYGDWLNTRYGILLNVSSNVSSFRRHATLSRTQYHRYVPLKVNHIHQPLPFWTALTKQQPTSDNSTRCTGKFLLSKMSSPWMKIPCDVRMENSLVICEMTRHFLAQTTFTTKTIYLLCSLGWILSNKICFMLIQFSTQAAASAIDPLLPGPMASQLATLDQALAISVYLSKLIRSPFSNKTILVQKTSSTCLSISSLIWIDISLATSKSPISIKPFSCSNFSIAPDLILLQKPAISNIRRSCLQGQFTCSDGTCILTRYICDGKPQCPDHTDETDCNSVCLHRELEKSTATYCFKNCSAPDCACSEFYFQCSSGGCVSWRSVCDCVQDCIDNSDELLCDDSICIREISKSPATGIDGLFHCANGISIPLKLVNDIIPDCPNQADEEIILEENNTILDDYCQTPDTFSCAYSYPTCFSMTDLCVAAFDDSGFLVGCRNGAHLENCEMFQCPRHFKCPSAYCIPTYYVCNGIPDCPNGEDEMSCSNLTCPGLLECHLDNLCVHPDNVNDGTTDCIQSADDEDTPQIESCVWNSCRCRSDMLICSNTTIPSVPVVRYPVRVLDISGTSVILHPQSFREMQSLLMLDLSRNQLTGVPIDVFNSLNNLIILHLDNNNFTKLFPKYFTGLANLRILTLSGNPLLIISTSAFLFLIHMPGINLSSLELKTIEVCAFNGMTSCVSLNLSNNALSALNKGIFCGLLNLNNLDLRGNPLLQMDFDTFASQRHLQTVFFPHSTFCCVTKEVEFCIPPLLDAGSSCNGLIPSYGLKWVSRGLAGIIVLLNITSLAWWVFSKLTQVTAVMVIVSMSDLLMGVSVGIVVGLDTHTQDVFLSLFTGIWRHSAACILVSALSVFSFGMSQYFLVCLSGYRFVVTRYPFSAKQVNLSRSLLRLSFCGCAVFLGLVFLVLTDGGIHSIRAPSETCSLAAFVISDHGISTSFWLYCTVNGLMTFGISAFNCCTIHALIVTMSKTITQSNMRKTRNLQAILRLITSSLAAVITWLAVFILAIISLGFTDHSVLYNAVASFVLIPLNSVINPLLYSFTSPQFAGTLKGYFLRH